MQVTIARNLVRPRTIVNVLAAGLAAIALHGPSHGFQAEAARDTPPHERFVKRDGVRFMLDGEEFPVVGANNYYVTFASEQELKAVLDEAVEMEANVIRIFLQPVIGSLDLKTKPTIWDWRKKAVSADLGVNGAYMLYWDPVAGGPAMNDGPNGLGKLDVLLDEAGKRNLKLIVAFLDFWKYTGGAHQISAWYGSDNPSRFFGRDPRARAAYKAWVKHVIERTNAITGVPYRDDPTIMAWQLMNEPDIRPARVLRDWIQEMAGFVKSLDPHHLLSTGHWNLYDRFSDMEIDEIDFGTWHAYPIHWGVPPSTITRRIPEFCAKGRKANKPILLEEFGYARSNPDYEDVYRQWLDTIYGNPDCAGWLVWSLVARQDTGQFPTDEHEQFDIRNDGSPIWSVLRDAALKLRARRTPPDPADAAR